MSKDVYVDLEKLDEEKIFNMLKLILKEERRNVKTKAKSDSEMVKIIRKIIEEEVKCL